MESKLANVFEEDRDSGFCQSRQMVVSCLRLVIALQCIGIAGRFLFSSMESESDIFEYLLFEKGVAENIAQTIDDIGAYGCLVAAIVFASNFLMQLCWSRSNQGLMHWIEILSAVFVSAWSIANALSHTLRGELYSELTLGEVAVRIACPLVLVAMLQPIEQVSTRGSAIAKWILTLAISTTFVVHGYKAIMLYGPFVDLILLSDLRVFNLEWEQETVESMLLVIGWIDVALAIALLVRPWRAVAIYMLIWGMITACSRMTALGWSSWPETMVRAANWGAPCVLLIFWRWENRRSD